MSALELLIRGVLAGLIISVPVGPVNVLVVQRTIAKGCRAGLVAGLGAAFADTMYGAIAGFSITFVIRFLILEQFWIRLGGGCLLILIGIWYYRRQPQGLRKQKDDKAEGSDFAGAFLLNLTNPTTVLSFLAVLAVLGLGGHRPSLISLLLVAGIFCGAMLWWTILSMVVNQFRDRFTDKTMLLMNHIAGLAIGGFGIVMIVLGLGQRSA
jgi:threonine/homoserine/homoserine lactone efflux protein